MQIFPPVPSFLCSDRTGGNYDLVCSDGQVLPVFTAQPSPASPSARVVTPNGGGDVVITPGTAGKLLAVIDITPQSTGLVVVSGNFFMTSPGDIDDILMGIKFVEVPGAGTITGGTLINPGLTQAPTSTTPDVTAGTEPQVAATAEQVVNSVNTGYIAFASVPIQLTPGERAFIAFLIETGINTTVVTVDPYTISAIEV